ncbi:type II secretion system protein, partial [Haemophilus influenzae]
MQKGMTLVELLIGLAIISIALNFAVPLWKT